MGRSQFESVFSCRYGSAYLCEFFQTPGMVFTGVMAWEICRGDIRYSFGVDSNDLVVLAFC